MSKLSRYGNYSQGLYGLPHMGEIVADYRKRKGDSQEAFAIVCGVDKQTVVYWENQKYLTEMKRRIFLCKVLAIPPALLGLTWRSMVDENQTQVYVHAFEHTAELLQENAYGLYEGILTLAHTGPNRFAPTATYRFNKHMQELEKIVERVPDIEKDSWLDLLSRYYQHETFIAQHHEQDSTALLYANRAVEVASNVEREDAELLGSALYRRARIHLIHGQHDFAKQDSQNALKKVERARGPMKGNAYLLAAEVNVLYAQGNEKLKTQCRKWQDDAAKIMYKGGIEEDETFLWFNLYAVHHERAKTLTRFALFHTTDEELVEQLKNTHVRANSKLLEDAQDALASAKGYMNVLHSKEEVMYHSITEARFFLIAKEFEESAKTTKNALESARAAHSQQGIRDVKKLYILLNELTPQNPHVRNLGVELGIY